MALYAELDNDQCVIRVVVCDDPQWLVDRLGGTWVETGPTTPEEQGAGPGLYDSEDVAPLRFIPPWVQPQGAHDAIEQGAWRWHNGRAWRSLTPDNVWEPGVSGWREMLTAWPEWVQPTGAHDAYQIGERVTFQGVRYTSTVDANVWRPDQYPQGWQESE